MDVNTRQRSQGLALSVLRGKPEEVAELQRVLEAAPGYARRTAGTLPEPSAARDLFAALPPGKSAGDKFVFGIYLGSEMIGCADVVRGYPDVSTATVGLLLLSERHQGRGLGCRAYGLLEDMVRSWQNCDKIRVGVVRTNDIVLPFWKKLGFVQTGERKPYQHPQIASEVLVLQKTLESRQSD